MLKGNEYKKQTHIFIVILKVKMKLNYCLDCYDFYNFKNRLMSYYCCCCYYSCCCCCINNIIVLRRVPRFHKLSFADLFLSPFCR